MTAIDEPCGGFNDLRNVVGGERIGGGPKDVQPVQVVPEDGVVFVADLGDWPPALPFRNHDHIVVDVRNVLDVLDGVTLREEVAAEGVELDVGEGMPEVRNVVRRNAADVHRHATGRNWPELLNFPAK
ncbi:MAG: hypothetical protein M5U18_01010 [Dehalococcoidia bacterium]|nr:hypothetical protein [Dehalococcoidia bacterium]